LLQSGRQAGCSSLSNRIERRTVDQNRVPKKGDEIMLRTIETLSSYQLGATDGPIGQLNDFYFDDEHWALRYLVVDTGKWLPARKVLISPMAATIVDWRRRLIEVDLSREQVKNAPSIDTDAPVSRQYEARLSEYYGYPYYWVGAGMWAGAAYPAMLAREAAQRHGSGVADDDPETSHLRSANEVRGYHIRARDRDIGHVEDFVLDDETWAIKYLVIDTSNWLGGRLVVISPQWITGISWHFSKVHLDVAADDVRESPEFNRAKLNDDLEKKLAAHYRM
jgi:hypothetical protein